jgi:hypothetical protein
MVVREESAKAPVEKDDGERWISPTGTSGECGFDIH